MKIITGNESPKAIKARYPTSFFALIFAVMQKESVSKDLMFKRSPGTSTGLYCFYCQSESCIRKGIRRGIQKLFCKSCLRWQQTAYKNHRYNEQDENRIRVYHNEGLGASAIGRLLKIPRTSVQMLMERKAEKLSYKQPDETQQVYLMDELQTFVGRNDESNRRYVISIMNKQTGAIIETTTGRRRKEIMRPMIERLLRLNPKRIETDGWSGYLGLIPKTIHRTFQYLINKLERFHLTVRQHVRRLTRKTMSFSKSERMLDVSVKLFCC